MFLLVFVRHVGAHSNRHQLGVSKQIPINLGKFVSSDTSCMKCSYDLNLGEGTCIFTLYIIYIYITLYIYVLSFARFWSLSIEQF